MKVGLGNPQPGMLIPHDGWRSTIRQDLERAEVIPACAVNLPHLERASDYEYQLWPLFKENRNGEALSR
jgi:hypothetical protein